MWPDNKAPKKGDRTNDKILTKSLVSGLLVQLLHCYYSMGVFPTPVDNLASVSPDLDTLYNCYKENKVSDEARPVFDALKEMLKDTTQYTWASQHMSNVASHIRNYLEHKHERSLLTFLLFFAHMHHLQHNYLNDTANYPILDGGYFHGLKTESKEHERFNSIRLQRENCDTAMPVTYPAEMNLCDCTLPSFAPHVCKPITDARGEKRSSDFELMEREDDK